MQNENLKKILSLIDLTSLNDSDTDDTIVELCKKAHTSFGSVAAVCVYPKFVPLVAALLRSTPVKIATVVNFPSGDESIELVIEHIQRCIADGAQEIDVVFPYRAYLAGSKDEAVEFVSQCKSACGDDALLKVILETGNFPNVEMITAASRDVIDAGADFVKTSTGKVAVGATPEAVEAILQVIKETSTYSKRAVGCKVSGGVRTIEQAEAYLALANKIQGESWVSSETFRIGTSQLVDEIFRLFSEASGHLHL